MALIYWFLCYLQVLSFVISHIDVISAILRDRHSTLHVDALQELALVTAVVGRSALDGSLKTCLLIQIIPLK